MSPEPNGCPPRVPATAYATSWSCNWTDPESGILSAKDIELLKHVNCSYLSSGKAPTLVALKQHVQSLVNLIRTLTVSTSLDARGDLDEDNDAFDWLRRLDEPYDNEDEHHHTPLWSIANHVKMEGDLEGINLHCPLEQIQDSSGSGLKRPYQTHQNLTMHANACLEILDHEFGATGGLMSMLPEEDDTSQMEGARNTLLGQWLLHHQHLVGRMHELEINLANAVDLLSGEAIVPLQMLKRSEAEGHLEVREVAYPQDRFILANVGDDVFDLIHWMLDEMEEQAQEKDRAWEASGVLGDGISQQNTDGEVYSRGIVHVDIPTRFYRLKDEGKSTIFMLPTIKESTAVAQTRKMEQQPTVVTVAAPTWPQRVSQLERRMEEKLAVAGDGEALAQQVRELRITLQIRTAQLESEASKMRALKAALPERYHHLLDGDG